MPGAGYCQPLGDLIFAFIIVMDHIRISIPILALILFLSCSDNKNNIIGIDPELQSKWKVCETAPKSWIENVFFNSNNEIFVTGDDDLSRSSDYGITWTKIYYRPLVATTNPNNDDIYTATFAGLNGWATVSRDNGSTWVELPGIYGSVSGFYFTSNGRIILTRFSHDESYGGIQFSDDNGQTWSWSNLTQYAAVFDLVMCSDTYMIITALNFENGLYEIHQSADTGETWNVIDSPDANMYQLRHMENLSYNTLIGGSNSLFISNNLGLSWNEINVFKEHSVEDIYTNDDIIFVLSYEKGENPIYYFSYSVDAGNNWILMNDSKFTSELWSIGIDDKDFIYIGTQSSGLLKSKFQVNELIN